MRKMRLFTRTKEHFTCENCNTEIVGNGYTNHCTQCLWSKHVDICPGDRQATCKGMMKPISVEKKGETYVILHSCVSCGHQKKNKISSGDDFQTLVSLST